MAGQIEVFQVTIASGDTLGEVLPAISTGLPRMGLRAAMGYGQLCTIFGPATLAETASVEVSPTDPGVTWYPVTGVVPAAAALVSFVPPAAKSMRIKLNGAAAADRVFKVGFRYDMGT